MEKHVLSTEAVGGDAVNIVQVSSSADRYKFVIEQQLVNNTGSAHGT